MKNRNVNEVICALTQSQKKTEMTMENVTEKVTVMEKKSREQGEEMKVEYERENKRG